MKESPTKDAQYTRRLERLGGARWKRWLNVQAPYRWNVRRLRLGWTLDLGSGIGRNLLHLDGQGVGVDHNAASVSVARHRGLVAFTPEEFHASKEARPGAFDSLLAAHLVEHMTEKESKTLLAAYVPYVRPGGKVVVITPQERGYASDATHVRFMGFSEVERLAAELGLTVERQYSYPLPRPFGHVFTHNEFVTVCRKPVA